MKHREITDTILKGFYEVYNEIINAYFAQSTAIFGIAQRNGEIAAQLESKGTLIPTNDIWVAATVFETGSRLITSDMHFNHVPGLLIMSPQRVLRYIYLLLKSS